MKAETITLECSYCHSLFERKACTYRGSSKENPDYKPYCSHECQRQAQYKRVEVVCNHCGKKYHERVGTIQQRKDRGCIHNFCSRSCAYASPLRRALLAQLVIQRTEVPCIKMTDCQIGYIAGIIDGEGSFAITPNSTRFAPHLTISNTNLLMLKTCYEFSGIGTIFEHPLKKDKPIHHRRQYIWAVSAINHLDILLPILIPCLVIKKEQARLMHEYCKRRIDGLVVSERDLEICDLVKQHNRSRPDITIV